MPLDSSPEEWNQGKLKILGPAEDEKPKGDGKLKILGVEKEPLLNRKPAPQEDIQKIAETYTDKQMSALKSAGPLALGFVPGVGAMAWPARAAFMGLMGAGSEAWGQTISRVLGAKAPSTSGEAAKEVGKAGLAQGAAEVVGAGTGAFLGRMGQTAVKAKELLTTARKFDLPISAAELTGGGMGRTVQQIGESVIFGRRFAARMRDKFFAGLNVAADDSVATLSHQMTQQEAGASLKDAFQIARGNFHEMSSALYDGWLGRVDAKLGAAADVIDITKGAKTEIEAIGKELQGVREKFPSIMRQSADETRLMQDFDAVQQFTKQFGGYSTKAIEGASSLPKLTVREAQRLRSQLRDLVRDTQSSDIRRLAQRFEKVVNTWMDDSLKAADPGLASELDGIDKAYREGMELFQGKAYNAMVDKFPEEMAHSVGIADYTKMKDIRTALVKYGKSPEKWDLFRRMWLQDKMAAPELTGIEPGQRLAKGIVKLSTELKSKANPIAEEFFGDATGSEAIRNITRLSNVISSKATLGAQEGSHLFVNYAIVHSLLMGGLIGTGHLETAAATAAVPALLTRMMYSRTASNLLVKNLEVASSVGRVFTPHEISQVMRAIDFTFREGNIILEGKASKGTDDDESLSSPVVGKKIVARR
jgi:hypothetical protein